MDIKALRDSKAANIAKAKKILEDAGENELTADQQAAYDTHKKAIENLTARIKDAEDLQAAERAMAGSGHEVNDNARITEGATPELEYGSFGEFLTDVAGAVAKGNASDKLKYHAAATGHNTTVNSDGGFLVRKDWTDQLLDRAEEEAQLLPLCTRIPIGPNADGLEAPVIDETSRASGSRWGGVRVYRKNEADTVDPSKVKVGKIELRLEDLMGLTYVTDRGLQDAVSLEALISKAFGSEFGFEIDDEIINGTGSGECLGILNSPALIQVAKETGQDAATVVWNNVVNMRSRMRVKNRAKSVWLLNPDCEPQLQNMHIVVGTGGVPVYLPASGAAGTPYDTLFGRPILPLEQCAALGTLGDILYTDMSDYLVIEKGGMQASTSMHVRFLQNEQAFKFVYRINGQPITRKAITPYKGSNTKSPYIGLATRA